MFIVLPITIPWLSPGIWSLWCPGLYCKRPSTTPAIVWSGREDTWVHVAVLPLHGARGTLASLHCSDAEKIRPDLATPAFGLTLPLPHHGLSESILASTLSSPVFRALSSEQPRSPSLLKLLDFLAHSFPRWLQRHSRQGSSTEHEGDLASHADCLKRPSNQRAKRCLGNHLAQFPRASKTEAQREEGTGLLPAHRAPLCKLEMVSFWMEAVLGQGEQPVSSQISGQQTALCGSSGKGLSQSRDQTDDLLETESFIHGKYWLLSSLLSLQSKICWISHSVFLVSPLMTERGKADTWSGVGTSGILHT